MYDTVKAHSMFDPEKHTQWSADATEIMFGIIEQSPDGFTADEFYTLARQRTLPPDVIKRFAGKLFREFQASGYIEKTDNYRLSERNGSTPLPIWRKAAQSRPA